MTVSIGIILIFMSLQLLVYLTKFLFRLVHIHHCLSERLLGLVLGDVQTGLMIGATLQLMTLGVATYGGATVPDFLSGAIMGTAYAIISGKGQSMVSRLRFQLGYY